MSDLRKHLLYQADYRGKVIQCIEGFPAMLKLWALSNTSGKKTSIVVDPDSNEIIFAVRGRGKDNYPEVFKNPDTVKEAGFKLEEVGK